MNKVYFDTAIFITAFEADDRTSGELRSVFDLARSQQIVTSEITLAEVFGKESSTLGWVRQKRLYLNLLVWRRSIDLRPVSREILIGTADYRRAFELSGRSPPKLADAIHAVTAVTAKCQYVFTADKRFHVPHPLQEITLDDKGLATLRQALDA